MKKLHNLVLLAIVSGVASCSGLASKPIPDQRLESKSLSLISAIRSTGHCGDPGESWKASSVTLSRLESAFLNNPWVSITEFSLNGGKRGVARSWCGFHRITCTFSNGRVLRVYFEGRKTFGLVDGDKFRLHIPTAEYQQLEDLSEWVQIETESVVDDRKSEAEEAPCRSLSPPAFAFESSLAHKREEEPATLLSATRFSPNLEGAADGSTQSNPSIMKARGATLHQLEDAVQGWRRYSIMLTRDGDVPLLERDEEPAERITCETSDGQTVVIHVYASDGAWCVVGEGPFHLSLGADETLELLNPTGWEAVD